MSTPFAFVPRKVSRPAKSHGASSTSAPKIAPRTSPTAVASIPDSDPEDDALEFTAADKGKGKAVDQAQRKQSSIGLDIATLISLSLSDYNIWLDADLRRKLDECLSDSGSTDGAGFVPISYLIRRAPFRGLSAIEPSETEVVKALRAHANDTLEVRMLVSAPSSSVWYGPGKTSRKKDVGGYEVRRKDWAGLLEHPSRNFTRAQWDELTVYMECVPSNYRTIAGIVRFAQSLLELPETRIQNVTLPPHYLDKPGETPKCKGYALVTLSTKEEVLTLLEAWPWRRRIVTLGTGGKSNSDRPPDVKDALKFGFRTICKARWEQLNEEYLAYRQQLVDEMVKSDTHSARHSDAVIGFEDPTQVELEESSASPPPSFVVTGLQTTYSSPYPFNCLVFVRNIHPETNKTTLKALFSQAFPDAKGQTSGLDYVDFNKGMDSCYLRLASPHHATILTEHFVNKHTTQAHGLDGAGRIPTGGDKEISMEVITGKKEELYWEKVPEKVRRQAVEKAVKAQRLFGSEVSLPPEGNSSITHGQQKRKRDQ
ncbi:hypothetical protein HYDPIDRAFT_77174 [Hydnomerulius pinastri MD-312]|nr:hypothetical protein HYDPIDRAFT_77174 [Hydnomerulius pinastri MD-312]